MSARAFSVAIGVPDSNTRNYLSKGTKLNADYLESIVSHFNNVNLNWLVTGQGELFTGEMPPVTNTATTRIKKVTGGAVHSGNGNQLITLEACQQELENTKRDMVAVKNENELLKEQLASKDALLVSKDIIIASKDDIINLLRDNHNRPS